MTILCIRCGDMLHIEDLDPEDYVLEDIHEKAELVLTICPSCAARIKRQHQLMLIERN